jgi:hypothetical protein
MIRVMNRGRPGVHCGARLRRRKHVKEEFLLESHTQFEVFIFFLAGVAACLKHAARSIIRPALGFLDSFGALVTRLFQVLGE